MKLKFIVAALLTIFKVGFLFAASDTTKVEKFRKSKLKWQKFYLENKLVKTVTYKYGKKENSIVTTINPGTKPELKIMKVYRINGSLLHDVKFVDSKPEGFAKSYLENGQLCCLQFFKNGKLDSVSTVFHDNGQIFETAIYKEGRLMQILEKYDRMGLRLEKGNLANGFGVVNQYDETGRLIAVEHYQKGKCRSRMKR